MKLVLLHLENFKAFRDYTFEPNGQDTSVFGENASGKTSLYDGFTYCLFGTDSQGQTDFEMKTLDETGTPYPGLEHGAEVALDINGNIIKLRRTLRENWTKKRGSSKAEFTGHETQYFMNDVPANKRDFDARVSALISQDTFKLLSGVKYFNEQLHWTKRREILLSVCGDITDAQVIASDVRLATLPMLLRSYSLDDYRKIITAKRTMINKELEQLPVRIDEVSRSLPAADHTDAVQIATEIDDLSQQKKAKEQERLLVQNGGGVVEKKKQLESVKLEIQTVENARSQTAYEARQKLKTELGNVVSEADSIRKQIHNDELDIGLGNDIIVKLDTEMDALRNRYDLTFAREHGMLGSQCLPGVQSSSAGSRSCSGPRESPCRVQPRESERPGKHRPQRAGGEIPQGSAYC